MSGQGAVVTQAGDWSKHNALLSDLINLDWPVRYFYEGKQGTLVYYVGAYLLPALFGKIGGDKKLRKFACLYGVGSV